MYTGCENVCNSAQLLMSLDVKLPPKSLSIVCASICALLGSDLKCFARFQTCRGETTLEGRVGGCKVMKS